MTATGGHTSGSAGDTAAALLADWRFRPAADGPRRRRRPAASAGEALRLAAREMRLVLTLLLVLFVTAEAWQVFGRLSGPRFAVLLALFVVLAAILGARAGRDQAGAAVADARFRRVVPAAARTTLDRRLRLRTWFEILIVGLAVWGGFVFLGVIIIDAALTREWAALEDGRAFAVLPVSELWHDRVDGPLELYRLGDSGLIVSEPLLRVAGVLGAFATLVFALEVLVDTDLRTEVTNDLLHEWTSAREAWEQQPEASEAP